MDLGSLSPSGDNCSDSEAINDQGAIAGESENGVIDPLLGVNEVRAVLWYRDRLTDLGTMGGNASGALSINNREQVGGFALNPIPDPYVHKSVHVH